MAEDTDIVAGLLDDAEAAIARGAMARAQVIYRGVLNHEPANLTALMQLAGLALVNKAPKEALAYYQIAAEAHPRDPDVHHGLATAYRDLDRLEAAELALETVLRIDPGHEPALFDKARLLQDQKKYGEAEHLFLKLASTNPSRADVVFNRGVVLFQQGKLVAAERWFQHVLRLNPDEPRALINLALIYRYWRQYEPARRCLDYVLEKNPGYPAARWNLANLELLLGNLKKGFDLYESRFERSGFSRPERPMPLWDGSDLNGKSLLLVAEQGLGDTVQFIRFAAILAAKGIRVGLEVQPQLQRLLATVPGVDAVHRFGEAYEHYDAWLPIMSLGRVLKVTLESIPANVPYVDVPQRVEAPHLDGDGLRVGLVWRGNKMHVNDAFRSVPLVEFEPVLKVPGIDFYSLQIDGHGRLAKIPFASEIIDLSKQLSDMAVTAAVIAQLDIILTVDTAVAHVAGAMDKPTWIILSSSNDWRWLDKGHKNPWYPSVRLYRTGHVTDWGPVMHRLAEDFKKQVAAKASHAGET